MKFLERLLFAFLFFLLSDAHQAGIQKKYMQKQIFVINEKQGKKSKIEKVKVFAFILENIFICN